MAERKTLNGVLEVLKKTGLSCPKAARRWLKFLGISWTPRELVIDETLYDERIRAYNEGRLPEVLEARGTDRRRRR